MRKAFWICLSFAFAGFNAESALHDQLELSTVPCGEKALMLLQEWEAQDSWLQKFSENPQEKRLQSPTATFGKWVQVKIEGKKSLILSQFSESSTLNVKFDSACKPLAEVQTVKPDPRKKVTRVSGIEVLNDQKIEKVLNNKKPSVFFLWSPHMQISIEALREIQTATRKLGLSLYAVVEPGSNPTSVQFVAKKLQIPMKQVFFLDSFDLSLRGMRLHFPSLIVANKGRFTSPIRRGHEDAATYEDFIRTHL